MLGCKRGEAVEKRKGGVLLFESRTWYGKRKIGGVTSRVR